MGEKFPHLPPENQGCLYASERPRLDSDFDIDSDNRSIPQDGQKKNEEKPARPPDEAAAALVRQVLNSLPSQHQPNRLIEAAELLHTAMRRRGERANQPPDDVVCAQFLACGDWQELQRVVMRILQTSSGGKIRRYSYFVTAALEQIHGIKPGDLYERREQLRPQLLRQIPRTVPSPPPPPPEAPKTLDERANDLGLTPAQMRVFTELEAANPHEAD